MRTPNNKIALVTGGTGGIGTAICERLYKDGFTVVANYRNFTKALKWRQEAKKWRDDHMKMGFDLQIVEGNVSDFESTKKMIELIQQEIGVVDILVNNAGITQDATLVKMTPEQWHDVINANLNSVFNCSKLTVDGMIEKKWGRIINISSVNGQKGQFGQANYAATKAGIYGFTKSLALELARKGITVNSISPGYIGTSMVMAIEEEIRNKIIAQVPMGRLGKPEEIANCVSFLASNDTAYMTGANLAINGGLHMY